MESIDPVWQLGGIALVIGFLIGTVLQMRLKPKSSDIEKLKADLEQTRSEMEKYKASVNRHFNKTSDLVNELTQDYVKVYQHLSEGAQSLSDTPVFAQMLEQSQGRVLISVEDERTDSTAEVDVAADPLVDSIDGSSKAAAADRVEAERVEAERVEAERAEAERAEAERAEAKGAEAKGAEAKGADTENTAKAWKRPTERAADDTTRDDDRRDPAIGDSPQQVDTAAAIKAEADSVSVTETKADKARAAETEADSVKKA